MNFLGRLFYAFLLIAGIVSIFVGCHLETKGIPITKEIVLTYFAGSTSFLILNLRVLYKKEKQYGGYRNWVDEEEELMPFILCFILCSTAIAIISICFLFVI
jgi:hypothetical protein